MESAAAKVNKFRLTDFRRFALEKLTRAFA
jgi:hypothetical protein